MREKSSSEKSIGRTNAQRFALDEEDVYDDGHLRVEHYNYYVAYDGKPISLARSEFLIVSRLAKNPERTVTTEDLWRFARGDHKPYNPISLRVYIYRLRSKLEPFGLKIETMINVGYRLVTTGRGDR
ncbi:MAG: helix-turn-helix domain-containing protein [Pyrinomonadaceae bacterium]